MDRLKLNCHRLNSGGCRVVDGGRPGWLARGLQQGGPADNASTTQLNKLLGQKAHTPTLEFTLSGGQWLLHGKGQIAIGGADMQWRLNDRLVAPYTAIDLDGDYLLKGDFSLRGARSYLAVRGEWLGLPQVWGSSSPGAPGIKPCQVGDTFTVESSAPLPYSEDLDVKQHLPALPLQLSVLPGPEWPAILENDKSQLLHQTWKVSANSSRQGLRLQISKLRPGMRNVPMRSKWSTSGLNLKTASIRQAARNRLNLISSPVLPGTIQLTPNGPILLFRDAQTLGGYPRALIAEEASLNHIGQLKPGDELEFNWCADY